MGTRRADLLAIKLKTLAGLAGGDDAPTATVSALPQGAALLADEQAWVLIDGDAAVHFGGALAWSVRMGARRMHLIADEGAGIAARRAGEFSMPITVWRARDRSLEPVEPADPSVPVSAPSTHVELAASIVAAGADVVVEHGIVTGEVRGLEVCRVVDTPDGPRLEVGVGAQDREAFQLLHAGRPTVDALAEVVQIVARHRQVGAEPHPFNRLARERFIRWRLVDDPDLIDAVSVAVIEPPVPRHSVAEATPCVAAARMADGADALVVCSAGVDLELIPYAADARRSLGRTMTGIRSDEDRRLLIVLPERDRLPILVDLLALVDQAAGWSSPELLSLT